MGKRVRTFFISWFIRLEKKYYVAQTMLNLDSTLRNIGTKLGKVLEGANLDVLQNMAYQNPNKSKDDPWQCTYTYYSMLLSYWYFPRKAELPLNLGFSPLFRPKSFITRGRYGQLYTHFEYTSCVSHLYVMVALYYEALRYLMCWVSSQGENEWIFIGNVSSLDI